MTVGKLLLVLPLCVLSGCYHAHNVLKKNTGLEFGHDVNLCPGGGVKSQKSCEPSSDHWKKADKLAGATLVPGSNIFERIENDYLLQQKKGNDRSIIHTFSLWSSQLNNPKTKIELDKNEPAINLMAADFIVEPYSPVKMSELYEKDALTTAEAVLTAEANAKDIQLEADFLGSVKSELRKKISESKNTTLTYHYAYAEYVGPFASGGKDSLLEQTLDQSSYESISSSLSSGNEIIVGICGIVFSNLVSTQSVVEDSMLSASIDASLKFVPANQKGVMENLKASASAKWSNKVNEKINTAITTRGGSTFFYPLWVKTVSAERKM